MTFYRFVYAIYRQIIDTYLSTFKYKYQYENGQLSMMNKVGWVNVSEILNDEDVAGITKIEADLLIHVKQSFEECKGRIYDFHFAHQIPEKLNKKMYQIAKDYFNNENVELDQTQFQLSKAAADFAPLGHGWHVDDYRRILKFFLYTTPVSEENGAMSYIQKSHLKKHRIKKFLWDWTKQLKHTYFADVSAYPKDDFLKLIGDKFSMFAVDTAGLHSANSLISGERIVFVFNFREVRYDPTGINGVFKALLNPLKDNKM